MSLVTEELRSKAEIYHGDQICLPKTKELLKEIGLPNGLLPLKDVIEFGYNREKGFIWYKMKKNIKHKFEKIGNNVSYDTEVSAYVERGKISKIKGVKAKELLIWVTISDIYVDDPSKGVITFKSPMGLTRSHPFSAFEVEEAKSSGVKEI